MLKCDASHTFLPYRNLRQIMTQETLFALLRGCGMGEAARFFLFAFYTGFNVGTYIAYSFKLYKFRKFKAEGIFNFH